MDASVPDLCPIQVERRLIRAQMGWGAGSLPFSRWAFLSWKEIVFYGGVGPGFARVPLEGRKAASRAGSPGPAAAAPITVPYVTLGSLGRRPTTPRPPPIRGKRPGPGHPGRRDSVAPLPSSLRPGRTNPSLLTDAWVLQSGKGRALWNGPTGFPLTSPRGGAIGGGVPGDNRFADPGSGGPPGGCGLPDRRRTSP